MPTIAGNVAFALSFTDTTATPGVSSVNTISMSESLSNAPAKVAVLSGTVGTSSVSLAASSYKDSDGNAISVTGIDRVFLVASGTNAVSISPVQKSDPANVYLTSKSNEISMSSSTDSACSTISLKTDAGTNDYVVVLYGT